MRIRRARPAEGERLREIAIAAKSHWGYDLERVRAWAARGDFSSTGLRAKEAYVAEVEQEVVGWAALIPKGEVCWLDDLWIEPAFIGAGIGSRLFRHAAARAAARLRAHGMGGRAERDRLLREDGRAPRARKRAERVGSHPPGHGRRPAPTIAPASLDR